MKVLYLLYTPHYSGAEIVIENIILHNRKLDYIILAGADYTNKKLNGIIRFKYIRALCRQNKNFFVIFRKFFSNLIALNLKIFQLLKKDDFRFVHIDNIQLAIYLIPFLLIKQIYLLSSKTIWHNQNLFYKEERTFEPLEKLLIRLFNITIVPSNAVKKKLRFHKNIKVLYSGVDLSRFNFSKEKRARTHTNLSISKCKIVIGIFGIISEKKGQLGVINVYKKLQSFYSNLHLLIIGRIDKSDSNFVNEFNKEINKLNKNQVIILNWVKDIENYYSAVDIFINNTQSKYSEPLGTTIIEAMASECIVLASDTGGTPEIIEDSIDGFLFNADSEVSLERKLDKIITQIDSLDYVKKNARKKVERKFNINKTVENYNNILNSFLK